MKAIRAGRVREKTHNLLSVTARCGASEGKRWPRRTNGGTSAPQNDFRVGGAGGYGGFYCFALGAAPYQAGVSTR